MRIWCVPSATELESPKLPPRIDRDVYLRSPPPPPRLSKEQKLARGVIVLKNRTKVEKHRKIRKGSTSSSSKSTLESSSSPPPPPPRKSPTHFGHAHFGSLPTNGSVIGTSKYSSSSARKSRSSSTSDFKAHINNGGSVTSNSLILHPGTSKTRQKKIKRRKRGKYINKIWNSQAVTPMQKSYFLNKSKMIISRLV